MSENYEIVEKVVKVDVNGNELVFVDFGNGFVLTNTGYHRISLENYEEDKDYRIIPDVETISGVIDTQRRTDIHGESLCFIQLKRNGKYYLSKNGYRRITLVDYDDEPKKDWRIPEIWLVYRIKCVCETINYVKAKWDLYSDGFIRPDTKDFITSKKFRETEQREIFCSVCEKSYPFYFPLFEQIENGVICSKYNINRCGVVYNNQIIEITTIPLAEVDQNMMKEDIKKTKVIKKDKKEKEKEEKEQEVSKTTAQKVSQNKKPFF